VDNENEWNSEAMKVPTLDEVAAVCPPRTVARSPELTTISVQTSGFKGSVKLQGTIGMRDSDYRESETDFQSIGVSLSAGLIDSSDFIQTVIVKESSDLIQSVSISGSSDLIESVIVKESSDLIQTLIVKESSDLIQSVRLSDSSHLIQNVIVGPSSDFIQSVIVRDSSRIRLSQRLVISQYLLPSHFFQHTILFTISQTQVYPIILQSPLSFDDSTEFINPVITPLSSIGITPLVIATSVDDDNSSNIESTVIGTGLLVSLIVVSVVVLIGIIIGILLFIRYRKQRPPPEPHSSPDPVFIEHRPYEIETENPLATNTYELEGSIEFEMSPDETISPL
jgi:hypothetical protein